MSTGYSWEGIRQVRATLLGIDVINVYNVYEKFFVNAFIILSTFILIKIT